MLIGAVLIGLWMSVSILDITGDKEKTIDPVMVTQTFEGEIYFLRTPLGDSLYTIGMSDGALVRVRPEEFKSVPANGGLHPLAVVTATAVTVLPKEAKRVQAWTRLTDFLDERYRAHPGEKSVKADLICTVYVLDRDEFTQLQANAP